MKKKCLMIMLSCAIVVGLCACGAGGKNKDSATNKKQETTKEDTRPESEEKTIPEITDNCSIIFERIDRETAAIVSYYIYEDYDQKGKYKIMRQEGTVSGIESSFSPTEEMDESTLQILDLPMERKQAYTEYFNKNIVSHFPADTTTVTTHMASDSKDNVNEYQQLYIEVSYPNGEQETQYGTVLDSKKCPEWVDGLMQMLESDVQQ